MDLNINVHRVRYHRNGVMGTGFYLIDFTLVDDDGALRHLRAVQFDDPTDDTAWRRLTAVLDPTSVAERFRGDELAEAVRDACKQAEDNGTAFNDAPDLSALFEWLARQ